MIKWTFTYLDYHARIQKVLSEGSIFDKFFFSWWGEGGSFYHYRRAIIGPPVKRHLNDGVSLACRQWPNIDFLGDSDQYC